MYIVFYLTKLHLIKMVITQVHKILLLTHLIFFSFEAQPMYIYVIHCFELLKNILDSEHSKELYCISMNYAFLFTAVKSVQLDLTLLIIGNLTLSEISTFSEYNFFDTTKKTLRIKFFQYSTICSNSLALLRI